MTKNKIFVTLIVSGILVGLLITGFLRYRTSITRSVRVRLWINHPEQYSEWSITAMERCGDAPFILPTDGFIGYLWDDSFKLGHRHQGIDIFGGNEPGLVPVYSASDGYLTRQTDWKSSLIIRIPDDPIHPGRQIWIYYTHLADQEGRSFIATDFPLGTSEKIVKAGNLLGYQGNYSGDPQNPVGVHLHFSIVKDNGQGKYLNELNIQNTLDPSPYLGLILNSHNAADEPTVCH
jgi:peptidoglycan LD-endopeptidase LytH